MVSLVLFDSAAHESCDLRRHNFRALEAGTGDTLDQRTRTAVGAAAAGVAARRRGRRTRAEGTPRQLRRPPSHQGATIGGRRRRRRGRAGAVGGGWVGRRAVPQCGGGTARARLHLPERTTCPAAPAGRPASAHTRNGNRARPTGTRARAGTAA
eukprot:scaffold48671_cov71-Phaeocystis_antarctica.AAC.4